MGLNLSNNNEGDADKIKRDFEAFKDEMVLKIADNNPGVKSLLDDVGRMQEDLAQYPSIVKGVNELNSAYKDALMDRVKGVLDLENREGVDVREVVNGLSDGDMDELMGNLNSIEAKDVVSSTYVPESTGFGRGENVNGAENQSVIAERHAHYRKVANNAQKKAS